MSDMPNILSRSHLERVLATLVTPAGIQASDWELYRGAVFGRDSLMVGLDLVRWYPEVALVALKTAASHQGTATNLHTEEEPGRIHHEHRPGRNRHTQPPSEAELARLADLVQSWQIGSVDDGLTYYGTVDATPQFIRLLRDYVAWQGDAILDEPVIHARGEARTLRTSLEAAARWIIERINHSSIGLVEFQHTNPRGITFQVLRDGGTAYLHPTGDLAHSQAPIAALEVQALAYDALLAAAELLPNSPESTVWRTHAAALRQSMFRQFWIPGDERFAMAIDRDDLGTPRLIVTHSSAEGELLDTRVFDDVPKRTKRRYVEGIIGRMYSPQFLTDVGLRMRAHAHAAIIDYCDYQGTYTSWVVTTNIFARGLRRQGFPVLATEMEERYLRGIAAADALLEFFFVDLDGHVHLQSTPSPEDSARILAATNLPERTQAWTLSAALRAVRESEHKQAASVGRWQASVSRAVLQSLPPLRERQAPSVYIDRNAGLEREQAFLAQAAATRVSRSRPDPGRASKG